MDTNNMADPGADAIAAPGVPTNFPTDDNNDDIATDHANTDDHATSTADGASDEEDREP